MNYDKLKNTELFLFDMDGTLYLGDNVYEGAVELMEDLPRLGKKYIYLTNNSSRAGEDYITRLRRLGFPCKRENVFTSGMATGMYLNQRHPGAKVYLAGTKAFYRELVSYGIDLVNDELGHTESEDVDVVVQGFDTELVYEKLDKAVHFLRRGAHFIAANPDWVCPTWYGSVPDCGSVCEMLYRATKRRPVVIGKPQSAMVEIALERTGCRKEETVIVGDRLYTDIACGVNAGIDSVFVLSGEGTEADIETYHIHPTWVFPNIGTMYRQLEDKI